jgi:hypothetical protein
MSLQLRQPRTISSLIEFTAAIVAVLALSWAFRWLSDWRRLGTWGLAIGLAVACLGLLEIDMILTSVRWAGLPERGQVLLVSLWCGGRLAAAHRPAMRVSAAARAWQAAAGLSVIEAEAIAPSMSSRSSSATAARSRARSSLATGPVPSPCSNRLAASSRGSSRCYCSVDVSPRVDHAFSAATGNTRINGLIGALTPFNYGTVNRVTTPATQATFPARGCSRSWR